MAFFGLKRAYWGSLGTTRRRLQELGLTAARFDMLYAMLEKRSPVRHRFLVRELGVTSPVVCRMLKSLRELGYVDRERDQRDRRAWLNFLTPAGRLRIRRAIREFITDGVVDDIVEEGLCPRTPPSIRRQNDAFRKLWTLESLLDTLRDGFDAGGRLYYPWHPDD
jgi:DNA-binding MarR family transcriptional regulator